MAESPRLAQARPGRPLSGGNCSEPPGSDRPSRRGIGAGAELQSPAEAEPSPRPCSVGGRGCCVQCGAAGAPPGVRV